ncbi:MAG TPA: adenylate/guanylate cyclase domain-containing protein, partial [Candidatus Entotheonella sp.]
MRFFEVLNQVIGLLVRERRVTYQALKLEFDLDDAFLEGIRMELIFAKRLAVDEDGLVLVWTGETQREHRTVAAPHDNPTNEMVTSSAAWPTLPPIVTVAGHASTVRREARPPKPTATPPDRTDDHDSVTPSTSAAVTSESAASASEAERRQLTVMFCDLVGSTHLSSQLDPEDLRDVIRAYQETAAAVIQRYAGHIAQYLGDGLLIYFGFPVAHEDDAQRAVYTGLGICEAMTTLNMRLETAYPIPLAVRIGIHTGPVVVGEIGGGGRHENLALGETPNIAARLEGLARPNTVVISDRTAQLVQRAFVLEAMGPQDLKGVAAPILVSRVLGPLEPRQSEDESVPAGTPFLVGRDEETGLLRRRWEQAKAGQGQVVLLSGEAGIGKSTLTETLRAQVHHEGLTRIVYRCSPYHTNTAFYPVMTHLENLLRFEREDAPAVKLDKLERGLQGSTLQLDQAVPLMATFLAVELPEGRYPPLALTPQQQRQQTHDTLAAWLLEEAERQPVLAVWEDVHWADPSTLELLSLLIDQTPTVPMLSVVTYRPEFAPPWSTRSHMMPITLNRLEHPQVEALVGHLAGGKWLPAEVVKHVVTKTDGVPLFVEELTKMLLESTLLSDQGDHYALTGPLSEMAIPATLRDSLMARLDRLPSVRVVAQLGAILGREFEYDMLRVLTEMDDDTLQEGLSQLVDAELLYQRGRPPRARYVFKHALVQDAAYASLLRSTRQHYHQRIAQVLVERFPETTDTQPELIAYHYTEASLPECAIDYWQKAGQRAIARSAHAEAIAHLTQALDVLKRLSDPAKRTQYELDLQLALGQALTFIRGQAAAEVGQAYNRARALCLQIGDDQQLFRILYGLWHFHAVRAELPTVRELSEELLRLAQRLDDPMYLHGAHWVMGGMNFLLGEFTLAREHWEQCFALYDFQKHPDNVFLFGFDLGVFSLCWQTHALWHLGYPDQALLMGQKALDLAESLSHPFSLAVALDYVAMLHQFRR